MISIPDRVDKGQNEHTIPIPWAQYRAELEALYQPPMVARGTRAAMISVLREVEALGIESTADLTITLITRLIAGRPPGQSDYTLWSRLAVVRTICTFAETAGYLRVNPFRLRKLSKWVRLPSLAHKRHLSREEIRAILDLMAKHVEERSGWAQWRARRLQALTAIIAYTGVRRNECLFMHVADVDLAARVLYVRPHKTRLKTVASEAPIPIPEALVPILSSWLAHQMDAPHGFPIPQTCDYLIPTLHRKGPWHGGKVGCRPCCRLKAVAKLAGVEGATFQTFRRSWATHAEYHGLGEAMISRVLRHTTTRTARQHYRKADLANMASAVNGFDF
jgi:integrase